MATRIPKNSTPIKNKIVEMLASGKLNYLEMRIALHVIRKTTGYATKEGRQEWTHRLTHEQISKNISMCRTAVSMTIKSMLEHRILIKQGKSYKFNDNFEEWKMSRNMTVCKSDKKCLSSRQKMSQSMTRNACNLDNETPIETQKTTFPGVSKETYKETLKETVKKDSIYYKDIERLVMKFKKLYESQFKKRMPKDNSKKLSVDLMTKVYFMFNDEIQWQKHAKSRFEYICMLIERYFRLSPISLRLGITGFVMKAMELHSIETADKKIVCQEMLK